jgi:hypothetical protein
MTVKSFTFKCDFLNTWIRIRIGILNADPDPTTQMNADPCGSGSKIRLEQKLLPAINERHTDVYWYILCDSTVHIKVMNVTKKIVN